MPVRVFLPTKWATRVLLVAAMVAQSAWARQVAPKQTGSKPAGVERVTPRRPRDAADRDAWLANAIGHHHFTMAEVAAATGLAESEVAQVVADRRITPVPWIVKPADDPLKVLPFPGGRHPRIGFREGAIDPQRETKASVFAPWSDGGYVVVDLPEAIWSNLGLTYLAHTHIPTIWTKQQVELPPTEWRSQAGGLLVGERTLPNGIAFSATVRPKRDHVRLELAIRNGSTNTLTGLRAQVCVMLAAARGFERQSNANKQFIGNWAVCQSECGKRWILAAFAPLHRAWANPPCPCLHADPKFADCAPGQSVHAVGCVAFHEGDDIREHIARLESQIRPVP